MTLPFENDTGPVIKKLASRSIQTDKRRNLFVIVTIALAAALMAAIFCCGACLCFITTHGYMEVL